MPGVKPLLQAAEALTGADTFTARVYPRNEFVHTRSVKTDDRAVTAPPPARAAGSVDPTDHPASKLTGLSKGSNARLKHHRWHSLKIDQGRSLSLRAPQGCLRYFRDEPGPKPKPARILSARQDPVHQGPTKPNTSSRHSDYSLVKERKRSGRLSSPVSWLPLSSRGGKTLQSFSRVSRLLNRVHTTFHLSRGRFIDLRTPAGGNGLFSRFEPSPHTSRLKHRTELNSLEGF
jgi:hypothetical protein